VGPNLSASHIGELGVALARQRKRSFGAAAQFKRAFGCDRADRLLEGDHLIDAAQRRLPLDDDDTIEADECLESQWVTGVGVPSPPRTGHLWTTLGVLILEILGLPPNLFGGRRSWNFNIDLES
jgi:hypothetical protein